MVGIAIAESITWDLDDDGIMYKPPHTESGSINYSRRRELCVEGR
jgi:hypothetical protein